MTISKSKTLIAALAMTAFLGGVQSVHAAGNFTPCLFGCGGGGPGPGGPGGLAPPVPGGGGGSGGIGAGGAAAIGIGGALVGGLIASQIRKKNRRQRLTRDFVRSHVQWCRANYRTYHVPTNKYKSRRYGWTECISPMSR